MFDSNDTPGKIAYNAYFRYSQGKSLVSGAQLPTFDEQKEEIKKAWEAAAEAVIRRVDTTELFKRR